MREMKIEKNRKALLVIDVQEDYTGATAKPPFPYKDSKVLIEMVNKLGEEAINKGIIVAYIRQEFEGFFGKTISKLVGHGTAIKGNPGTEFDKRIRFVSDYFFTKPMPDAFTNPSFEEFLNKHQVGELYLVGLDAAGCVHYTARGALKRGYKVSIVKDGILLLAEKQWDSLLEKYTQDGITLITSKEL